LILLKRVDEALQELGSYYSVDVPRLKVGMPTRYRSKVGCYVSKTKTICVVNQEKLGDPFVILHEFYHHLRAQDGKRRRTEKNANKFALEFIEAFKKTVNRLYKPMLLITPPELPSMTRIIFLPLWSY